MKKIFTLTFVVMAAFALISCESETNPMTSNSVLEPLAKGNGGGNGGNGGETAYTCDSDGEWIGFNETNNPDYSIYSYTLWAGKHNDAGTVTITNDDNNIYVTYNTNSSADLGEVHVYVWEDSTQIPSKRPSPGHADYVVEDINADTVTITIPRDINCGDEFYISTHAALVGNNTDDDEPGIGDNSGETAYGGSGESPACFDGQKGAWWGFVTFPIECFYDISGTVYEDGDNSGDLEAGESGFEGLTVTLLDSEGNVLATTTTAADGSYLFEHVAGGADYSITTEAPAGDYLANENSGGYSITDLSADVTEVDFGFVPLYDIFVNVNLNVIGDCLPGLEVSINGVVIVPVDGVYSLLNQLPATEYVVYVAAASGDEFVSSTETIASLDADTTLTFDMDFFCPTVDVDFCPGNIVVNGSFEDHGPNYLAGWTINGSIDILVNWLPPFPAYDGVVVLDMLGSNVGSVSQVLNTVPGATYELSFALDANQHNDGNPDEELLVTINGQTTSFIAPKDGVVDYEVHTLVFTANSTTTNLSFSGVAAYGDTWSGALLDAVCVVEIDGPVNPPSDDDFPLWGQDISHVVLVFSDDSDPNGADGSCLYTIKVDEYQDNDPDDLDDDIDAYLAALVDAGYLIDGSYDLLGSSIKGGQQTTSFYAYGSYNTNGDAADTPPAGLCLTYDGTSANEGNQSSIDVVIDRINLVQ